jgi:hypothetical protein
MLALGQLQQKGGEGYADSASVASLVVVLQQWLIAVIAWCCQAAGPKEGYSNLQTTAVQAGSLSAAPFH